MGGHGSGRKSKETELVDNLSIQKQNAISEDMFLPNHSGVASSPEMIGDSGFVKKTGDTMTGNLIVPKIDLTSFEGIGGNKILFSNIHNTNINAFRAGDGSESRLDLNSLSETGSDDARITMFRETNTTGSKSFIIFKGNGTTTSLFNIDADTGELTSSGDINAQDLNITRDNGELTWTGVNDTNINTFRSGDGTDCRMDFNLHAADGSSGTTIGFFRNTNTTGNRLFTIFKGNNTTTTMFSVNAETGNITMGDGSGNMSVAGSSVDNLLFTKSDDNRVGIGTATPAELLDVDGNACIAGTLDAGATTLSRLIVDGSLIWTNIISNQIGINNNNPNHTLDITGDLEVNGDILLDTGSITSASGAISFGNENLTTTGTLNSATITTIGLGIIGGDLQINGGDITSTGSAMRFTGLDVTVGTLTNGQITISEDDITSNTGQINFGNENLSTTGTLTVTKLEVNDSSLTNATGHISSTTTVWNPKANGTIGASTLQLSSDVTGGDDNYGASLAFSRLDTEVAKSAAIVAVQTSSDVDQVGLAFFTHPSATTSADVIEQMRIEHDGKIGIGTTSPSTILHAKDAGVNSAPAITLENDARAFSFEVDGSDGDKLKIRTDVFTRDIMSFEDDSKAQMMDFTNSAITINGANQDIDFIVKDDAGNTAFFIQGSDGNVGIGTTSPSDKLEVIGNITANKISSDVVITGETTNADARLVLNNTGNGRHSGIQLVRERLSGTGMTAASIFVNSDTSTNNTQLIIQCNSSTNIGSLGPTDQRIVLDSATDTMDIDNCSIMIQEIASARIVKAGYGQIWVKNTTPCELWFTDDAGTDTQIV